MNNFLISGFSDEISDHLGEQIAGIKKLGMEYVEMRSVEGQFSTYFTNSQAKEIRKQLDDAGIKVSSLASRIGKYRIRDAFAPHLEEFRHALEVAHLLNTKYIRVFSFFIDEGDNPDDFTDEVLRRLEIFKEEAKGSGITLLHENEKLIYGNVPQRCKVIAEELFSPEFGLVFDPSNFIECNAEAYPYAFEMLVDYVKYVHIKDCRKADKIVVPSGMGDGCIKEILKGLKEHNYSGFLSLEPHLADYAGLAYDVNGTPKATIKEFVLAHQALVDILETMEEA